MDSPQRISVQEPQTISPCNSRRRRRSSPDSNSPEFEFWMVRNPSFPQPNLVSADELFVDGVLLPLHLLHLQNPDPPNSQPDPDPDPEPEPGPEAEAEAVPEPVQEINPASITATTESTPALTASKRWKDIFKKSDKKPSTGKKQDENKEKERKREKKSQGGASSAELNINIWPFSRSRSAGNSVSRPKLFPGAPSARKVSSAPCSRSNSAGESKSRKWPSSPGRPGVHLGRSSPVWQVRRGSSSSGVKSNYLEPSSRISEKGGSKKEVSVPRVGRKINSNSNGDVGKARVLNLNVPMCIGYRHHLSCRSDEHSAVGVRGVHGSKHGGNGGSNGGNSSRGTNDNGINAVGGNNIFNFRSLFTKKVY